MKTNKSFIVNFKLKSGKIIKIIINPNKKIKKYGFR